MIRDLATFRRCWLEFGLACARRSFGSKEFYSFWPTFRAVAFLPNNPVVVDIGANVGQFATACLKRWKSPRLLCCEPIPEVYETLRDQLTAHPSVRCLNVAVASRSGPTLFRQSRETVFSSFLLGNQEFYDFGASGEVVRQFEVQCITLAELINDHVGRPVDLMKVDVQGAELEVLTTLGQARFPIDSVQLEVSFYELYKNQPLIHQVVESMDRLGYRLVEVYSSLRNKRGVVTQMDGLFRRKDRIR